MLRQAAGQFSAAPELIIESMLRNNELPEDELCVQCHNSTDGIRHFIVVCEQAETKKTTGELAYFLLLGWVGLVLAMFMDGNNPSNEFGRNIRYRLPLRICPACGKNSNKSELKRLFCTVPVYAHLMRKYPHAIVKEY